MKLKSNSGSFEPAPEYVGSAVCVDATPLKTVQTQYGPKEKFRFVFEIELEREDGSRYCVWSAPFTPSYHENSALRPFLKKWMGREMTSEEQKRFDLEDMVGRAAHLTVIHEHYEGEVFANIALIQPDKASQPLQPSGKYIRVKDRAPKDGAGTMSEGRDSQNGYRRAEQPTHKELVDHASVRVHVGCCKGLELRDLSEAQVKSLTDNWLPGALENTKLTADDQRLIASLLWWLAMQPRRDDDGAY